MGSRVSTASRKAWWPLVLYGLPWGLRARSVCALHLGQRPVPLCRLGQPGVEHERMVSCLRGWLRVWCLLVRLTLGREVCVPYGPGWSALRLMPWGWGLMQGSSVCPSLWGRPTLRVRW